MLNDGLKLTGKLSIAINDKVVQEVPNLVVTAGKPSSRLKLELTFLNVGTIIPGEFENRILPELFVVNPKL